MQESLRNGLIDLLDSGLDSGVFISSAGFDRGIGFLDLGLEIGTIRLVASRLHSDHVDALFGGFNVGHGHTSSKKDFTFKSRIGYHTTNISKNQYFFSNIRNFSDTHYFRGGMSVQYRTDLAMEAAEKESDAYRAAQEWEDGGVKLFRLTVNETDAAKWGKPSGVYLTATVPPLTDNENELEEMARVIGKELGRLLPPDGTVLVVGLGNEAITPDALGPRTVAQVLATRHIPEELARSVGLDDLRPCAVMTPGVLGNTGVESGEMVAGVCRTVQPAAVIAVDALAARSLSRLGCTVQLSDTGIAPGSGVGNDRRALCRETLGVPVIGVGVPTVVDAETVAKDLTGERHDTTVSPRGTAMMVTPREIDLMIHRAARLVAMTVHAALQPSYSPLELLAIAQ